MNEREQSRAQEPVSERESLIARLEFVSVNPNQGTTGHAVEYDRQTIRETIAFLRALADRPAEQLEIDEANSMIQRNPAPDSSVPMVPSDSRTFHVGGIIQAVAGKAEKCPRCGFMTANPFACPICKMGGKEAWLQKLADEQNADCPGPAQPVAHVPVHPKDGPLWSNTFGHERLHSADRPKHYRLMELYASPPSHPAPSEAAPERQEADIYRERYEFLMTMAPFLSDLEVDQAIAKERSAAQPAKGEGKP